MILNTKHYEIAGKFQISSDEIYLSVTNVTMDTFAGGKNIHFDPVRNDSLIVDESRYKTNCDLETAIPHYTDGAGRNILRIGWSRVFSPN